VRREDVVSLGEVAPNLALRGKFVSEALRPAESTGEWIAFRGSMEANALEAALQGVSLIEARDEREEALALAIAMREVLETPSSTVALVIRIATSRAGWARTCSAGASLPTIPPGNP